MLTLTERCARRNGPLSASSSFAPVSNTHLTVVQVWAGPYFLRDSNG